jgi:type IV secretion system protein VirB4
MFLKEFMQSRTVSSLEQKQRLLGLNELLGYAVMYDDKTLMLKDGAFSATFVYRGPDVDSSTGDQLDAVSASINHALRQTEDGWMVEFNLVRLPSTDYPKPQVFPDTISALIDDERRQQYQAEGVHFDTVTYLTLTWLPERIIKSSIKKLVIDSDEEIKETTLSDIHNKFEAKLTNIIDVIAKFLTIDRLNGSELLTFLHYCVTGHTHSLQVPHVGMYMDAYLASEDFVGGMKPKIGKKHIRVLNFMEFPPATFPTILDRLNSMPLSYRWSTRFIPMSSDTAEQYLKYYYKNWSQRALGFTGLMRQSMGGAVKMNGDAADMLNKVEEAVSANSSGLIRYGFLTNTITLMDENANRLEEHVRFITREIQQLGFLIKDEDINAVEGYLGSIPGHGYYNLRRPLMDSVVLSQIAPISAIYQGEKASPCPFYPKNAAPLFYSATSGSTPYRFNLHVKDVGHAMVIGPTGAGKSTLLGLMIAQHRKYDNSHVYVFDKDYSNKAIILALGGDYYDIGKSNNIAFAPLSRIEEEEELDWACAFVEELCILQKVMVHADRKAIIREALKALCQTKPEYRTLHNLTTSLQDEEMRQALRVYIHNATFSRLINAAHDSIENSSLMGFEMGWLLEQQEAFYIPVIKYLFRRLYQEFKHRHPTLLILEEAWLYLDNHLFAKQLKDWLKTLRKFNVAVIFTSQALDDVANSAISSVLLESCKTKIYLPNDQISDQTRKVYESCGLNSRQIEILGSARQKRDYYVTSAYGNRLIELGLGPVTLAFIGISRKEDLETFYKIFSRENPSWVYDWLEHKGLGQWAEYWHRTYYRKGESHA